MKTLTKTERRSEIFGFDTSERYLDFDGVSLSKLKQLAEEGFLDLGGNQNNSPSANEFIQFMEEYPNTTAHGFVFGGTRFSEGIVIEGLNYEGPVTLEMAIDIANIFRHADSFRLSEKGFRVWWD